MEKNELPYTKLEEKDFCELSTWQLVLFKWHAYLNLLL